MMRPSRRQVIAAGAALPMVGCAPVIKRNPQQLVVSLPSDITTLDGATTFLLPNQIAPNLCYQRLLKAQVVGGQLLMLETLAGEPLAHRTSTARGERFARGLGGVL